MSVLAEPAPALSALGIKPDGAGPCPLPDCYRNAGVRLAPQANRIIAGPATGWVHQYTNIVEGALGRIVVRVMPDGFQFIGTRARAEVAGIKINTRTIIRAAARGRVDVKRLDEQPPFFHFQKSIVVLDGYLLFPPAIHTANLSLCWVVENLAIWTLNPDSGRTRLSPMRLRWP